MKQLFSLIFALCFIGAFAQVISPPNGAQGITSPGWVGPQNPSDVLVPMNLDTLSWGGFQVYYDTANVQARNRKNGMWVMQMKDTSLYSLDAASNTWVPAAFFFPLQEVTDFGANTTNPLFFEDYSEKGNGTFYQLTVGGDTTSTGGNNPTIGINLKGRNTILRLNSSDPTYGFIQGWELGLIIGAQNGGSITLRPNNTEVLQLSSTSGTIARNTIQLEDANVLTFGELRRIGDPLPGGTSGIRNTSTSFTGGNMQFRMRINNNWQTTAEVDSTGNWRWLYNWEDQTATPLSSEQTLVSDGTGLNARNINTVQNGATGSRPSSPETGQLYFDTTLSKLIVYNGTAWVNVDGTAL